MILSRWTRPCRLNQESGGAAAAESLLHPLAAVEFHLNPKIGQQVMLKRQRAGFRYRARMTSGTWPVHWIMGLNDCVGFGDKRSHRPADYYRQQGRPSGDRLMGSTRAETVSATRLPQRESIERGGRPSTTISPATEPAGIDGQTRGIGETVPRHPPSLTKTGLQCGRRMNAAEFRAIFEEHRPPGMLAATRLQTNSVPSRPYYTIVAARGTTRSPGVDHGKFRPTWTGSA